MSEQLTRALSVRQPWALLLTQGHKKWEYRSRRTLIRERVYIYATQRYDSHPDFTDEEIEALPMGLIVGSVQIVDCVKDGEGFAWQCVKPLHYRKPWKPKGTPQPAFWRPQL